MSQRFQEKSKFDFGLYIYLGFLSLVFLGIGSVVYGAMQTTRLPNPGLAAYSGVHALYPQSRTSFFDGDFVPTPVAALEASEPEPISPTTVRSTSRPERKVASRASNHRKSSKRTASRMRQRQREVILAYAPKREYGFNWGW